MDTQTKNCQNCKKEFVIELADFDFYKKMEVPAPTWCPQCRMIRRMIFWNERYFFKKLEKRTRKEIFSTFPPESPIEIYDRDYWWSDQWDPLAYGREIDWSRPILAQIRELQISVPFPARSITRSVNSDYSNNAADLKNCYLCFNADASEDCLYAAGINQLKNSIAAFRADTSELIYEIYAGFGLYQCFFSSLLINCRNVWFSYDCHECSDCFGCVNLRSKKYCIFNVQYTKEEYEKKIEEMNLGSYVSLLKAQKEFDLFSLRYPRRFMAGAKNVNCSGDAMRNSKNTHYSFASNKCEDVKYSQSLLMGAKDSYDYTNWGNNAELIYESIGVGEDAQRIKFSRECYGGASDIEYSVYCPGSNNLFACVGLRNKQYCILNRQYSKEEYNALLPKLRQHMKDMPYVDGLGRVYGYGEFFPPEFSPFAIDESAVPDFAEMDETRAKSFGLTYRHRPLSSHGITLRSAEIPDHVRDAKDDILKEVLECNQCEKGYRVLPAELEFVRRHNIALSRQCPTCRVKNLVRRRNMPVWYKRTCDCVGSVSRRDVYQNHQAHNHGGEPCRASFITSYAPDRPEIVYCETCYQQEVA